MFPRLVLFDVDLTILRARPKAGPHKPLMTMRETLAELEGLTGEVEAPSPDGRTDPYLVRAMYEINGLEYRPELYERFMADYLVRLKRRWGVENVVELLPGVKTLVTRLAGDPRFALGLVTGNDERGARIKLSPFGLNEHFPTGGFGSDAPEIVDRAELVRIAFGRCGAHYRRQFLPEFTFVFGDTPLDVGSVEGIGARAVGVLTGNHGSGEMKAAGPCVVLPDLSDTETVFRILCDEP